ncbi:hypothetical protein Hanom_Chr03g00227861 [Helianthus anomalus]
MTLPYWPTNLRFYPVLKLRFYHQFKIMLLPSLKTIFTILLSAKNIHFFPRFNIMILPCLNLQFHH